MLSLVLRRERRQLVTIVVSEIVLCLKLCQKVIRAKQGEGGGEC